MSLKEQIKNRIDYKKLTETLSVQTFCANDEAMITYILQWLKQLSVTVQVDTFGNIYVTKGVAKSYPCVVAHTDTVQQILTEIELHRSGDTIFAFDPIERRQYGIGGDDKVGVYITLQLLVDLPVMKAVFFREEEMGRRGSNYSMRNHKEFYTDCGFVLMADRRGNNDIITVSGGLNITSAEFLETCDPIFTKYGYLDAIGICTDVDVLTRQGIGVSTVNLSCGYHEPHTSKEIVSISDINRCYNLMYDILIEHGDKKFAYSAKLPKEYSYPNKALNKLLGDVKRTGSKAGITVPVGKRQPNLFSKSLLGNNEKEFENFREHDVIKANKKVYSYIGTEALTLTGDTTCSVCKKSVIENVFYLPFEGRMYCTKCNNYVDDKEVRKLLQFLEVEDTSTSFVFSMYSNGWLQKDHAIWNEKITSWVSDELPF